MSSNPVIIIGGGLAGLCCARRLCDAGVQTLLLEADDDVGGRVRTDVVDGFKLDRGFQVLQTAYPEAQEQLLYNVLDLQPFEPGALIRTNGKLARMSDPWRRPSTVLSTAFNGVGTLKDRWKLAKLRKNVTSPSLEELWNTPDSTTQDYLKQECGFSDDIIQRFFRPWFSGVFFEENLSTSSRFFRFIFRMFALGDASLPANGMGEISQQLATFLPEESIRLKTRVASLDVNEADGQTVQLESGETLAAQSIVLAVEGPEAARLSGGRVSAVESRQTTCFYFAAPQAPFKDALLVLNGDGDGPINNLCVPSNVADGYAPSGKALISVSVVGEQASDAPELATAVQQQLRSWYGPTVDEWSLLRSYHIRHALPAQPAGFRDEAPPAQLAPGLYRCGDYCTTASIHGAMRSGRQTAEALLGELHIE